MRSTLFLLPLLALTACEPADETGIQGCTDMGCVDGFYVALEKSTWGVGQYVITADVDGTVASCQITIPLGTDGTDGCLDTLLTVETSGSELNVEEQSIPGVWVNSTQALSVTLAVTLDGAELGSAVFAPAYETLQPNGPECGPTCSYASGVMSL